MSINFSNVCVLPYSHGFLSGGGGYKVHDGGGRAMLQQRERAVLQPVASDVAARVPYYLAWTTQWYTLYICLILEMMKVKGNRKGGVWKKVITH